MRPQQAAIKAALHPKSAGLSDNQIAKHLGGIPTYREPLALATKRELDRTALTRLIAQTFGLADTPIFIPPTRNFHRSFSACAELPKCFQQVTTCDPLLTQQNRLPETKLHEPRVTPEFPSEPFKTPSESRLYFA